uniref:MATH domain-containing protein n=1 Tax=Amphimedon queenslandica TaxID=400682 RepID=A0A1X7TDF1_AMPQE
MTEYGEIFCRDDLILNDCDRGLKIKFPLQLTSQFRSMRLQFGDTFVKVESILQTIPQPTIDNIKKSLRFSYNTLRPQLDLCKDMNDILELMSDNSSLDDISMLEFLVNKLNIEEAKLVVQKYKEVIEEFSKTELSKCLHERFSYASPLQCESVTIVVDRKTDDLTLDDVRRLSANLFDELSPNVRLNVVRDDNSFTITCSFPLILSEQLIRAALNNIDVLKENKVKRLTIGYCTVYEESKIMKEEAESLKERLDTKNKMLNVSMAENNRFKKIAAETSQLLQKKVSHLTEREKENEKLTEINKLLEEKLALFQSEKEKDEKQPLTVECRSNKELKEQIFKENNENTKDEQRTEVEKILAEKEELQAQFDSYKRTMMAENEKLQTDLANARKEAEKIVTKMEELTYNIEIMKNEAMMTENDQITQLKLTRVPTLHDDWREPHTLPVEVLMTSFASHHKSNGYWYSPSFYSHKKGYKLCLRVRANGESEGSGTHLSIHIHLMRGDHDDTLKWPVRGKVKLVLLNRKRDENHFVEEIEFNDGSNPEATGRVINGIQISSGTAAFVGQGRAAFIPQDLLFQDYMKDDSIRIRITSVDLSGQGNSIPISVATSWPPIFEFRINNFSALQKSNGSYVSDYFYTHKKNNGYRFVFMVYPNGVGANKGKNVSIFAHLTKGENDDQLKFPFRGEITLQAVNCHANHDHAEKVIRINELTDPKETYGGRVAWYNVTGQALNGYGFPEFLRDEQLKYNEKNNTQYLNENDSMLFRVTNVRVMSI